ncbi:glycosyltransferase family 4 protein [Alkalicoccus halolimnae]|uniref:Glycosyltransferase family 4 protein n=1 Tax=Alkalicoccus halolimnae TaxID=1667239 RepID=A0AAJ8LWM3_9BACI|nr:glycosyltransferase family 4 protein [Alkalicoccus halolimnae]
MTIAAPHYHEWRGNKITAERMERGVRKSGVSVSIISSTDKQVSVPKDTNLLHGMHAYKFALFYKKLHIALPYIITLTGTDINDDIDNPERRPVVLECLENAEFIHVFEAGMKDKAVSYLPEAASKIFVIPQGMNLFPRETEEVKESGNFTFLLPSGVRKVKNIMQAVDCIERIHEKHNDVILNVLGPVIEREEGEKLKKKAEGNNWLTYGGAVPFIRMGSFYLQADVVLNTSLSEGQASSIMEGMAAGKPVLASDIPGNRSLIQNEVNGLLYKNEKEFIEKAELLYQDKSLREKLGENGRNYISEYHNPVKESEELINLYQKALSDTGL